jgi:hypothetical protein
MDNRLDPSCDFLRPEPGARWDLAIRGGIAELFFGSGSTFPQYAALHLDSGYLRLVSGPCDAWGTSVVVVPTVWERGARGPVQGAPVTIRSVQEEDGRLAVSFAAQVASLQIAGQLCFLPPVRGRAAVLVSVALEGDLPLETRRPWDMFKPLLLSSMWVSADRWDASQAFADEKVLSIPRGGWIAEPPLPARRFGLYGGSSRWQQERRAGPAPAVEVLLGRAMPVAGWVTPDDCTDHDNVGLWPASSHVLGSWRYSVAARLCRELRPTPTLPPL